MIKGRYDFRATNQCNCFMEFYGVHIMYILIVSTLIENVMAKKIIIFFFLINTLRKLGLLS